MSVLSQLAQATYYKSYDDSPSYNSIDSETLLIIGGTFFIFAVIAGIIYYAIHAVLLGMIFKKAGVEQWIAWVPFYNSWKMLELGGQQGFWAALAIVPFVNIASVVFMYIAMYNIGLKMQKEGWFIVLAIFFPLVWLAWLAFDNSTWQNGAATAQAAPKTKKATTKK